MGDDIVSRLRCLPLDCDGTCWTCTAADEIERLQKWKAEADVEIKNWEAVWEAAGSPGHLGHPKQLGMLDGLSSLIDENDRLRAAGDNLVAALEQGLMATAVVFVNEWKEARHG